MISLTGLISQKAFGKFEMGKVISNPYANAFIKEAEESQDHEVSMAQNQLDSIIKHATELKAKMGENEKQIPAWIQDHITNSENYISQAASNYHEYGDSNEAKVNEDSPCWKGYKQVGMKNKGGRQVPNCVPNESVVKEATDADLIKNMQKTIKDLMSKLNSTKDKKQKEAIKKSIVINMDILDYWKSRLVGNTIIEK
jgi:ATP-dependent protease HslVU (ClpYQ) ATPase subunit